VSEPLVPATCSGVPRGEQLAAPGDQVDDPVGGLYEGGRLVDVAETTDLWPSESPASPRWSGAEPREDTDLRWGASTCSMVAAVPGAGV
jgi:hypothetical protein